MKDDILELIRDWLDEQTQYVVQCESGETQLYGWFRFDELAQEISDYCNERVLEQ